MISAQGGGSVPPPVFADRSTEARRGPAEAAEGGGCGGGDSIDLANKTLAAEAMVVAEERLIVAAGTRGKAAASPSCAPTAHPKGGDSGGDSPESLCGGAKAAAGSRDPSAIDR